MNKITAVLKTEFQRQLTYRADFLGYRAANLIEIGVQLIIWTAIFQTADVVKGYTYNEMITYVLISWFVLFLSSSYGFEDNVARDIKSGNLATFLIKPMSYLKYISILSVGRVSISMAGGAILMLVIIAALHPWLIPPAGWAHILIIAVMTGAGYVSRLFMAIITGFIAFWTTEVNGIYRSTNAVIKFLSGSLFPINLLPQIFVNLSLLFPFIYNIYIPTQLYLGKITVREGLWGLGVQILWLFLMYGIIKVMWHKGVRKFESVGI